MLNVFQTISLDWKPDGAIKRMQTQIPNAQIRLISSEDRRLTIRMISGILKSGITTAHTNEIVSNTSIKTFL